MEHMKKKGNEGLWFVVLGLFSLAGGICFGLVAAFQFLYPDFIQALPFFKSRPLHVSMVVAWIFSTAAGGIYYYVPRYSNLQWRFRGLIKLHFAFFLVTGLLILAAYVSGKFGGREYWEFPPVLAIPIFVSWIFFGVNYFITLRKKTGPWPVYMWMWGTGIVFFFLTLSEAYLWIFPHFTENIIREITIQWKAYGALVGSWNMMVYGTAIFLMTKISGNEDLAKSKMAFGLFLLGFTNLLFGWAHHTYFVPSAPWIRHFAYLVSMTELFILGKIIWDWRSTLSSYQKHQHLFAYRFLFASEIWIFLNLALALAISIPAINIFTHGTHITVAHSMGSTIGINTMILMASVYFIIRELMPAKEGFNGDKTTSVGFWITQISLAVFWFALLGAGIVKGSNSNQAFASVMSDAEPYLFTFACAGFFLMIGLLTLIYSALRRLLG
jgi:nitric oxide reductase subunit B